MADVSSALPSAIAPYSALTFAQLGNGPANSSPGVSCGLSDAPKNATERTNSATPALLINPGTCRRGLMTARFSSRV